MIGADSTNKAILKTGIRFAGLTGSAPLVDATGAVALIMVAVAAVP